jgi:hypothetical protein
MGIHGKLWKEKTQWFSIAMWSYRRFLGVNGGFVGSNGDQNHETEGYDEIYPTRNFGGWMSTNLSCFDLDRRGFSGFDLSPFDETRDRWFNFLGGKLFFFGDPHSHRSPSPATDHFWWQMVLGGYDCGSHASLRW